jgi:hypothetical protein
VAEGGRDVAFLLAWKDAADPSVGHCCGPRPSACSWRRRPPSWLASGWVQGPSFYGNGKARRKLSAGHCCGACRPPRPRLKPGLGASVGVTSTMAAFSKDGKATKNLVMNIETVARGRGAEGGRHGRSVRRVESGHRQGRGASHHAAQDHEDAGRGAREAVAAGPGEEAEGLRPGPWALPAQGACLDVSCQPCHLGGQPGSEVGSELLD